MVPDPNADGGRDDATPTAAGLSEEALYAVVREAVEDALLGAVGTLLLAGVGFVLVWAGGVSVVSSGLENPVQTGVGFFLALAGLYVAATTLRVMPPLREWV